MQNVREYIQVKLNGTRLTPSYHLANPASIDAAHPATKHTPMSSGATSIDAAHLAVSPNESHLLQEVIRFIFDDT